LALTVSIGIYFKQRHLAEFLVKIFTLLFPPSEKNMELDLSPEHFQIFGGYGLDFINSVLSDLV